MDIATISILVIIIGSIIGLAEWVRVVKNDFGMKAAQIRALETRVEHLEEQLAELKKDEELTEATVQKALEEKIINERILALVQEELNIQKFNSINN